MNLTFRWCLAQSHEPEAAQHARQPVCSACSDSPAGWVGWVASTCCPAAARPSTAVSPDAPTNPVLYWTSHTQSIHFLPVCTPAADLAHPRPSPAVSPDAPTNPVLYWMGHVDDSEVPRFELGALMQQCMGLAVWSEGWCALKVAAGQAGGRQEGRFVRPTLSCILGHDPFCGLQTEPRARTD